MRHACIPDHSRANVAHIRQSRPDSGLGFQVQVLETYERVPSSLGKGKGHTDLFTAVASAAVLSNTMYLFISFRKSTPPQNRQLVVLISNSDE